jgi:hypothetical protein
VNLTITIIGKGSVSSEPEGIFCDAVCKKAFSMGTLMTLTALAEKSFEFIGFEGDEACQTGQIILNTALHCQAIFAQQTESSVTSESVIEKPVVETPLESIIEGIEPIIDIPSNDEPIFETTPLPPLNIEDCLPTNHWLNTVCDAQGRSVSDLEIGKYGNLSHAVIEGTLLNQGWVSNSIITPQGALIGGVVTGYIVNAGQMADFEFRGATINGGTLAGTIVNKSQVVEALIDINFAAHAHLIGGTLKGHISGDPQAPALLEDVTIEAGSHLSGVILGNGTTLGQGVVFGR